MPATLKRQALRLVDREESSVSGKDTGGLETKNDRRTFLTRAMAGAAALPALELLGPSAANAATPNDHITCMELPPDDAATFTTTCQYCMVQCGYKVRVWEQGKGRKPAGSYTDALSGDWYSPSMVVSTEKAGKAIYIAVLPDKDCVVNKGEYSVRGGTNALTLFGKNLPEANKRLLYGRRHQR